MLRLLPSSARRLSYAALIGGLCRSRQIDFAVNAVEEMYRCGLRPDPATCCDPIVTALSAAGRFPQALGFIERYPLYGIAPDSSTYHPLLRALCRAGDLHAAAGTLKAMLSRGLAPAPATYAYFFLALSRSGRIDECVDLYTKLIGSGHVPDRRTYRLLIGILHEDRRLELVVALIQDMGRKGIELDEETGAILVDSLRGQRRMEEACHEFKTMVQRGVVLRRSTYEGLVRDLRRLGMEGMAREVSGMMREVLRSANCWETEGERSPESRRRIVEKARALSEVLKVSRERERTGGLRAKRKFFRAAAKRR